MKKYLIYLNERFPLQTHIPLIVTFTFSAICFSLRCLENDSFIPTNIFVVSCFYTLSVFFLLRISDEFKDHEDDMKYRKYLPVPRGLISLNQLRIWAFITIGIQLGLLYFFSSFFTLLLVCYIYLFFMYHEFFVKEWLKKHQLYYVISHMAIIPLVDLLASSAHWSYYNTAPSKGLIWFFFLSFFNGMVLEFGRKIKTNNMEEEGVVSYTKLYGWNGAATLWLSVLILSFTCSLIALFYIDALSIIKFSLLFVFMLLVIVSIFSFKNKTSKSCKQIEIYSGIWTLFMYFHVGIFPFIYH